MVTKGQRHRADKLSKLISTLELFLFSTPDKVLSGWHANKLAKIYFCLLSIGTQFYQHPNKLAKFYFVKRKSDTHFYQHADEIWVPIQQIIRIIRSNYNNGSELTCERWAGQPEFEPEEAQQP